MAEVAEGNREVWTTESDNNNANDTHISRISTASANGKDKAKMQKRNSLIGIQSKFRRKYFHKYIFILLNLIIVVFAIIIILMIIYYRRSYKDICITKECVRSATNLLQSMDPKVDPCADFYRFTCGNWGDEHPRPDNAHSNDWFAEKQNRVLRKIRTFLQSNGSDADPRAVGEARLMYRACMDTATMDTLGLQPIIDYLNEFELPTFPRIFNITTTIATTRPKPFNWIRTVAIIRRTLGSDLLVGFDIMPNPTNRTEKLLAIGAPESASMLPFKSKLEQRLDKIRRRRVNAAADDDDASDDDDEDEEDTKATEAHHKYMTEVISALLFYADPSINLSDVVTTVLTVVTESRQFEKSLYKIMQAVENSTSLNGDNPLAELLYLNLTELQRSTDRLIAPLSVPIWRQFLSVVFEQSAPFEFNASTAILTTNSDLMYLEQFVQLVGGTAELQLEFHMWWTVVEDMVLHTTSDIRKLHSDYMRSMSALDSGVSRSFYCTSGVHELLDWAVSWAVVDRQFMEGHGVKVLDMVHNIREAFNQMVRTTNWMDDGTKCVTLEKSLAMRSQIGYPEWLANGTQLDAYYAGCAPMNASRHLDNMVAVLRWRQAKEMRAFRDPYDLDEWATPPSNVNAFHMFQANAITIPLAILQYPFYDLGIEALNYGSIGTILGHELTHGFDDSGRMYDKDGNMRQWWTNQTITEYINRTNCFVRQYGDYYVKEVAENINGENTLGENIADNGGLREAFLAYQLFVSQNGKEKKLPGLEKYSSEQLFFMAYGNLWCEVQTITSIRWAMEDSHCPGRIRLKGVLQNSAEFAETFGCAVNTTMNPVDRCRIW